MIDLSGKRILFISARAFGIPENIVDAMKAAGANVDYFDERPSNSFFVKALIRINRNLIATYINKYHNKIIEAVKSIKYDYIFFIKAESFSENNLEKLLSCHRNAKSIIYYWDSIANNPNAHNLINKFDYSFSFDSNDCEKEGINFLPLFYFNEYKEVADVQDSFIYDLMFVGTTHSDRYPLIKSIVSQVTNLGGNCYTYFFFQGKIMFYRYKLLHKSFRKESIKDFKFKPLTKSQLMNLYKISKIIIDIQHPRQTGLTLRCFEALGSKRKLITTNANIVKYDFYNPSNILLIDRHSPHITEDFFNTQFQDLENVIYDKYSITSWLSHIFEIVDGNKTTNHYELLDGRRHHI